MATPRENASAATDLIRFLKALSDCRRRRGVRFPQWWMLLVAILSIHGGQGSLRGMERFANRHRKALNELFGTHIAKPPSESPFPLSLAQLDVEPFEGLLRNLLSARLNPAEAIDSLICDGKTLSGSVAENAAGAERYGLRSTSAPLLK